MATTHCLIGSISGVALVESSSKLNFKTLKTIVTGWVVTIPAAALFGILHFQILKMIF